MTVWSTDGGLSLLDAVEGRIACGAPPMSSWQIPVLNSEPSGTMTPRDGSTSCTNEPLMFSSKGSVASGGSEGHRSSTRTAPSVTLVNVRTGQKLKLAE